MRTENKKAVLNVSLAVSAFIIGIIPYLGEELVLRDILSKEEGFWAFFWLHGINFSGWGWFLGLCSAIASLVGTRNWKPSTLLLKGIVILFSVIAVVLALIWLVDLIFLSQFNW